MKTELAMLATADPTLPMRGKVLALESALRALPQAEMLTEHFFADGMYCRSLFRPAGTLIVGKVHKREHLYIVTRGRVQVVMDDGVKVLEAGTVLVSQPGTKRAVLALEDSVCVTVHRTNKRNLRKIERDLIEPDEKALFDSSNQLRALP